MFMIVVYFDQHLGAAHSECWPKYVFSRFFVQKLAKKYFFKFAPRSWLREGFTPINQKMTQIYRISHLFVSKTRASL